MKNKVEVLKKQVSEIQKIIKPKFPRNNLKWSTYDIVIRKPMKNPNFTKKIILTDTTWRYVEIYLKNVNKNNSLFFWYQCKSFYEATKMLPIEAKPLTTYYCFLNAVKALLKSKNIDFALQHGVTGKSTDGRVNIVNEEISFKPKGILSGLCYYLGQQISADGESYLLKDILYNIPYIHRAYTITYNTVPELFIPISPPRFVYDKNIKEAWIEIEVDKKYKIERWTKKIEGFSKDNYYNEEIPIFRRNKKFTWIAARNNPTKESIENLQRYYQNNRLLFEYIKSRENLWYLKRKDIKNRINHNSLVLTFAAMHRLSEMSRYEPDILKKHLEKKSSWLVTEFIEKSLEQFIDSISSEITGDDFRKTGART